MLLLTLSTFKFTGGIEKFNQCFLKAIQDVVPEEEAITAWALYDEQADARYISRAHFRGFRKNKIRFVCAALWEARKHDTIFIGHINLSILVNLMAVLYPKKQLILLAHGIEVWETQKGGKAKALQQVARIWSVSNFTKTKLCSSNALSTEKVAVFPNTIDPFFESDIASPIDWDLLAPYQVQAHQQILLTLTRLHSKEQYKGYDKVIATLPSLITQFPQLKYVLAGKYDAEEYQRVLDLIAYYQVGLHVEVLGYVADEVLTNLYKAADVFVMPSSGEGFGIVFLEAMAMGVPVIAGNVDGSVDALDQGRLGELVNPHDTKAIANALAQQLKKGKGDLMAQQRLQTAVYAQFGFDAYKQRLHNLLGS
jgi:glycosyltransferase involved in cell wall biosynthesis